MDDIALDTYNTQIKKILRVLAMAKCPAPLGYISLHSGIKEPLKLLEKMEEQGLIHRCPPSNSSHYMDPMFEI